MITKELHEKISKVVISQFGLATVPDFELGYDDSGHGDFRANIAFKLAKVLARSPSELAELIAGALTSEHYQSIDAVKGYLNITMTDSFWLSQLAIISCKYGEQAIGTGKKVQIEFISANPTGPLTLANARGGYLGDTLGNVLEWLGYNIHREYYINDAGGQVRRLQNSIIFQACQELGIKCSVEREYAGDYIETLARGVVELAQQQNITTEAQVAEIVASRDVLGEILSWIKTSVRGMGIHYDTWFSEASLFSDDFVNKTLEVLKNADLLSEKDGALWLNSQKLGDERDRVVRKSDGETTYLANDLAYHRNIFDVRGFDASIKIWGADHAGQVPSLKLAVEQLVPRAKLEFILIQMVRLVRDGQEFKVSKRAGTYITMDELLVQIPSDVARFFFLMRSVDSAMDFDLDLATEQSQKNPLYYIMYSYARACSVLAKAKAQGLTMASSLTNLSVNQKAIVVAVSRWPELLLGVSTNFDVHSLAHYGSQVASLFQKFYELETVISKDNIKTSEQLYFVDKYRQFMEAYFAVLGISPVDRMIRDEESP